MARRRAPKWEDIRVGAERKAIDLINSTDAIPIPLNVFAKEQKVKAIRFERLISTGGIRQEDRDYVIVIGIRAAGVKEAPGVEISIDSPRWDDFGPPVRFTIAHEIAHLLFYGLVPDGPNSALLAEDPDRLETACNRIAALLLLPISRLPSGLREHRFDVPFIADIIRRFKVSPEAFIWRFGHEDAKDIYKDCDGIIGLLRQRGNSWAIRVCHGRGRYIIQLLGDRKKDEVAEHLKGKEITSLRLPQEIETKLKSEPAGESEVRFPWGDEFVPFALQWKRLYPGAVFFSLYAVGTTTKDESRTEMDLLE